MVLIDCACVKLISLGEKVKTDGKLFALSNGGDEFLFLTSVWLFGYLICFTFSGVSSESPFCLIFSILHLLYVRGYYVMRPKFFFLWLMERAQT